MLSQLWSRINQDNVPCHYRADPAWRCETWLYHCCRHYANPHCCHYWYADTFGPRDDCEFITPEAYFLMGPTRVVLPLPEIPPPPPRRSVRAACWRALKGVGRSAARAARVYFLGREVVERREREARARARRRQIRDDEEQVTRWVELGYLGLGLWRRRLEDDEDDNFKEEEEEEYEEETSNSEYDDVGQAFLNETSVMPSVMEVVEVRDDEREHSGQMSHLGKRKRAE